MSRLLDRSSIVKNSIVIIVFVLLVALGVVYGVVAERTGLFPSRLADRLMPEVPPEVPAGYWGATEPAPPFKPADPEMTEEEEERLLALPYVQGSRRASEHENVTVHDRARAHPGLNLYVSGHGTEALLIDMDGVVVHRWAKTAEEAFGFPQNDPKLRFWRRARAVDHGGLLAIQEYTGIVRLDADSRVVWAHRGRNHHDLDVDAEGNVWVLGQRNRVNSWHSERHLIADDVITVLDPAGRVIDEFSVFDLFAESPYHGYLDLAASAGDIFHTNTLTLLDGRHAAEHSAFAAGNVLISLRELNTVAVIDPAARRVVWALSGMWRGQHEPVLLDVDRMLLFDNNPGYPYSRVIEFDVFTQRILWEYRGDEQRPFYSRIGGSCQRLPGGNTLITESTAGRAFEVTPQGEIVWEFLSPHRVGENDELVATLFDLVRLPGDYVPPVRGD